MKNSFCSRLLQMIFSSSAVSVCCLRSSWWSMATRRSQMLSSMLHANRTVLTSGWRRAMSPTMRSSTSELSHHDFSVISVCKRGMSCGVRCCCIFFRYSSAAYCNSRCGSSQQRRTKSQSTGCLAASLKNGRHRRASSGLPMPIFRFEST